MSSGGLAVGAYSEIPLLLAEIATYGGDVSAVIFIELPLSVAVVFAIVPRSAFRFVTAMAVCAGSVPLIFVLSTFCASAQLFSSLLFSTVRLSSWLLFSLRLSSCTAIFSVVMFAAFVVSGLMNNINAKTSSPVNIHLVMSLLLF